MSEHGLEEAVAEAVAYDIIPFMPVPERMDQASAVVRHVAAHENLFTNFRTAECPGLLSGCSCPECLGRIKEVSRFLTKSDAMVWEVWEVGEATKLAGILYLTDILNGEDALAHYVFFDGKLKDKTELLDTVINWTFQPHPELNWAGLRRLTVQVPDFAAALAVHATKHLGFGGEFEYRMGRRRIPVEGVKRKAIMWRGELRDILILGRARDKHAE